jgi:opacity protein-like surface antigen
MKRWFMVGAALAIASTANAQAMSSAPAGSGVTFTVGGGASFPTGDDSKAWNTGFNLLAAVGFTVPNFPIGIRVEGTYDRFGLKDLCGGLANCSTSGDANMWGGNLEGLFNIPVENSGLAPYILAGVGLAHITGSASATVEGETASGSGSDTRFAWNAGAGLRFRLSSVDAFVEARYRSIATEGSNSNIVPVLVGVTFRP